MRKTENGLVFPSDDSSEEEILIIKQHLQNAGFSTVDSEWLVDVFKRSDCFGDPNGNSVFREDFTDSFEYVLPGVVDKLSKTISMEKHQQTRLALLFSFLLELGPIYSDIVRPNIRREESNSRSDSLDWVGEFQRRAKFCAKNLDWKTLVETTQFDDLLPFLFPEGIPLEQTVDPDLLDPIRRNGWSSNDFDDPKQLEFWLTKRFRDNKERCNIIKLRTLIPVFAKFSEDVLGDKILGLLNSIYYAMSNSDALAWGEKRLDPLNDGWRVVAHELIPFMELLTEKHPDLNQERSSLLKAWWQLSKIIYGWSNGGLESELSDELRNQLVESASRHIGILRSMLRDMPEAFEDENVSDFYDKAFYVLLSFAPPWKRLRPLLLAFTEMTEQAVAQDLRTWREHDSMDNPPPIYSRVANWIEVAMYSQNLRTELQKDPYLQGLREEFAKFCLGRLRTKVKNKDSEYINKDFIEPRPAWRRCYVQALAALRVNPRGRAHRTLFWLLNNDPDETVKTLAKKAHKRVRHLDRKKPNLDDGASPRRPLFEAFWWLRQAHLITLGIEIDQDGAKRTRRKELHRTREKDDRYKWKR